MIYQAFLKKRLRRLVLTLIFMLLCMFSAVAMFGLAVTALNVSGAGALSVPLAFAIILLLEVTRYFFYRSFFLQQFARLAAWNFTLDRSQQ